MKREGRCREGGHRLHRRCVQPQPKEVGETGVEGSAAGAGESCPSRRRAHPFLRLLFSSSEVGKGFGVERSSWTDPAPSL
uniref:Uncharacterized protein n=1 Tax=Oryza punctata TaxID=4537 RepID=A0A0E0MDP9_ORYPU